MRQELTISNDESLHEKESFIKVYVAREWVVISINFGRTKILQALIYLYVVSCYYILLL